MDFDMTNREPDSDDDKIRAIRDGCLRVINSHFPTSLNVVMSAIATLAINSMDNCAQVCEGNPEARDYYLKFMVSTLYQKGLELAPEAFAVNDPEQPSGHDSETCPACQRMRAHYESLRSMPPNLSLYLSVPINDDTGDQAA